MTKVIYTRALAIKLAYPLHFLSKCQKSGWSCMCVLEVIGIVSFYVFPIGFWNCSDSMVFYAFQFIQI